MGYKWTFLVFLGKVLMKCLQKMLFIVENDDEDTN